MGDLQVYSLHLKGINGAIPGHSSLSPPHPPNCNLPVILPSMWQQAERATQNIINHIQPTVVSEQRRKAVVEYVQRLIRGFVSSEVFPFGSVPLKTYLPDGDIDLTAIGIPNSEDSLASDVRSILEGEEQNNDSEFEVKDVQYIQAEVKLVKCLVQNVVVDISFNQIGGLCTLCFLEQVDRFIGKEHLFKRSIILIKAWCYYESRILGAHHGLISTYALETLVLYIFHLFHSSLDGPLAVLYRFLDYYCKFDWDKYCISLHGPASLSSLPELAVEAIDNDGGDLLLTEDFLRSCIDTFSVPARGSESNSRTFIRKHLNIVDPLRESNNLGRSVSKGNFYRIRSAFTYGARKLERLLLLTSGSIAEEVYIFFMNTLDRHGGGQRPDVQDLVPKLLGSPSVESNGVGLGPSANKIDRDLDNKMKNIRISAVDESEHRTALHKHQNSIKMGPSGEVIGISSERLIGDAKDLATETTSKEDGDLDLRKAYRAPHLVFHPEHQSRNGLKLEQTHSTSVPLARDLSPHEELASSKQPDSRETDSSSDSSHWLSDFSSNTQLSRYLYGVEGGSISGPSSLPGEMSDLSGEYDMHLSGLNYALWCQEQILSSYFLPVHRPPQYSFYHRGRDIWNRGSIFAPVISNSLSPQPAFSPAACYSSISQPFISGSFSADDVPKTRGTGTYFPNTNYHANRERHSPGRSKIALPAHHMLRPQNNCQADLSHDMNVVEKGFHEPGVNTQPEFRGSGRGSHPTRLDIPQWASRLAFKVPPANANGILVSPDFGGLEFGSLGPVLVETPTKEHETRLDSSIFHSQPVCSPASSSRKSAINSNKERALQSYHLKDEEDFPPLSG